MKLVLFLTIIFEFLNITLEKTSEPLRNFCGVHLIKREPIASAPFPDEEKKRKLAEEYGFEPIRIILDTTMLEKYKPSSMTNDHLNEVLNALDKAVSTIKKLVNVQNYGPEIFSNLKNIFKVIDITDHLEELDNNLIYADFIILTRFSNEGEFPTGILASGKPEMYYISTWRPIVASLIISKDINFNMKLNTDYMSVVFLHELIHGLGFVWEMFERFPEYPIFYYPEGDDRKAYFKSPKLIAATRKYFGCDTVNGLELEDQGGEGTAKNHWEARILLGELMGAEIYQEEVAISEMTLAFLEDSGWYKVNYYTGGLMSFGRGRGCEFLFETCGNDTTPSKYPNEFFSYEDLNLPSCSTGRQSRTYFTLKTYDTSITPTEYMRVTGNDKLGGAVYTADYCFVNSQLPQESSKRYFVGHCKKGSGEYGGSIIYYDSETKKNITNKPNSALPKELSEILSDHSFCVMSTLIPSGSTQSKNYGTVFHPMCYEHFCSSSSLTIKIFDQYVVCPREGGNIQVIGFDGYLHCPDFNMICTGTVLCNDLFDCIDKQSEERKNLTYDYKPLTTQNYTALTTMQPREGGELAEDGVCGYGCVQCNSKTCKKCMKSTILVGTKPFVSNDVTHCEPEKTSIDGLFEINGVTYYCSDECNCTLGKYYLEYEKKCYNERTIPSGHYFNAKANVWGKCHENCLKCSKGPEGNSMNCDQCKDGLVYKIGGDCVTMSTTNNDDDEGGSTWWIWLIIIFIFLLAAGGFAFYYFRYLQNRITSKSIERDNR